MAPKSKTTFTLRWHATYCPMNAPDCDDREFEATTLDALALSWLIDVWRVRTEIMDSGAKIEAVEVSPGHGLLVTLACMGVSKERAVADATEALCGYDGYKALSLINGVEEQLYVTLSRVPPAEAQTVGHPLIA
jgi:hypothetical protein